MTIFQLTHPARGATCFPNFRYSYRGNFNSRTPRGVRLQASDFPSFSFQFQLTHPARGATQTLHKPLQYILIFQLTHPARGATRFSFLSQCALSDFNSRTPRGVRLAGRPDEVKTRPISTHAPREGCDLYLPPLQRRAEKISTHAPREGCDKMLLMCFMKL